MSSDSFKNIAVGAMFGGMLLILILVAYYV